MTPILALIQPFDIAAGARINVRAADAAQADAYGLGGQEWKAAVTERPVMSLELMSPDLDGKVLAGRSRISFNVAQLGLEGRNIKWDGAAATIYSAAALAWPAVTEFDGYVVEVSEDPDANLVTLTLQVSTDFLEGPLLVGEFTGGGGLLGEAAARGVLYPAGFGSCENIEPVWFDTTTWIGMIDGYANTVQINRLMEGLDDRGPKVADYANYAALKNAIDTKAIKPGQWGSCIAQGLVGLGAPPVAPIGVNAVFSNVYLGAIMKRILTVHRGVALGDIDVAAFDAMDIAVPRTAHYWTKDQRDVKDLIEAMASNLNATPLVTFQKKVTITRGIAAASVAELNRSGRTVPRVIDSRPAGVQKPVYRLRARAARPANVLSFDQVLYEDTIEDKGLYSNSEVYRSGHVVWLADKSSWIYVNATPGSGHPPPVWPIDSNAYWENMTPPATASDLTYADGTPIENLKPAAAGADPTGSNTAAGIIGQGALATLNQAPWATGVSGRPLELTDGRITAALRPGGGLQGSIWGGAAAVQIDDIFESFLTGKSLSLDSDFSRGVFPANYSVYDNGGGGKTTAAIIVDATAPNGSGRVARVTYDGTGVPDANPAPGFGGLAQILSNGGSTVSRPGFYSPNSKVAFIYRAKIPVGRTIEHASNTTGAEGGFTWITPKAGTGDWFTYIGIRTIGWTGLLSSTGHTYVAGGPNAPFSWNIARYEQIELSSEALPQLARLIDGTGAIRTDAELITLLGTSAAIVGQGYFATQNYADWQSRVVGTGKPSDNAGTTLTLYAYDPTKYTIQGNTVMRPVASAWDSAVFSRESLTGSFRVTASLPAGGTAMMFGVTDSPGAGNYELGDYCWYNNYGADTYGIYESGNGQGAFGGVNPDQSLSIEYDGWNVRYYRGGQLVRTTPSSPGRKFYAFVVINSVGAKLPGITFTPLTDVSNSVGVKFPLTTFGAYTEILGSTVRKIGGTHGAYEGGAYGTRVSGPCFISVRPVQQPTWTTTIGLVLASGAYMPPTSAGNWWVHYISSGSGGGSIALYKENSLVASWGVPNYTPDTRIAIVFNGRRVFAMMNGLVYGGDTSAYDAAPGSTGYFPTVWDYYLTGGSGLDYGDIRYGAWSDVRTYLDDGYTILNQAGFRTIEGTAAGITGQGPGATAPGSDVLNYIDSTGGGNGVTLIRSPVGGQYSYDGGINGVLRIDMPQPYINTMIRFAVDIFNYVTGTQQTYIISGYMYQPSASWINVSANYIGPETESKRVRFGSNGGVCCVWIGETGTLWQYPKIIVRDVMVGYSNLAVSQWKSGWGMLLTTTAPGSVNNEVTKPRAGDAVFGESIFESAGAATASLANFKTQLGTAAAILGQGALATLNQVNLATTQVLPRGSIPSSVANNGFTYTSNTNSITVSWPTMTVYRSDGSTISVASGSQVITGLSASTTYRIYPHLTDTGGSSASMEFITSVSPSFGSPAILYSNSSPNAAAAAAMYFYSRIPMGNFALATTASGGGGGGGGGGWNCLHEDMLLCQRPAGETEEGSAVSTPEYMGCSLAVIARVERHRCSRWIELYAGEEMIAKVTERHLFYRAADMAPIAAKDVRLGDLLRAEGDHVEVTGLRLCTRPATAIGIDIGEPHLHYAGPRRLVCHNGTAKP